VHKKDWHVLIVEDVEDDVQVVSQVLEHHGIMTSVARDGNQCLEMVQHMEPTLVIMDLAMPVKDGWDTLFELRANPLTAHIPVVAITAYHSAEVAQKTIEAGFDAYYPKPINPATIIENLAAVVS
jgi:CheY-like chemotaxis protein